MVGQALQQADVFVSVDRWNEDAGLPRHQQLGVHHHAGDPPVASANGRTSATRNITNSACANGSSAPGSVVSGAVYKGTGHFCNSRGPHKKLSFKESKV